MGLNGSQSEILREIVFSQFGGTGDNSDEFSQFIREKLDVNIFDTWTSPRKIFSYQVTDVLDKLRGGSLIKFLESLKQRIDGEADKPIADAISTILVELRPEQTERGLEDRIVLPRKILIAAGIIEKPIGDYIKGEMQEVMDDFEILCTWDRKTRKLNLPSDLDQVWGVAAVLRMPPRKEVSDPPLGAVEAALQRLKENRRVVLFTLDPRAQNWTEERIKGIDQSAFVETEQFYDEDDGRVGFFSTTRFKEARVSLRIREIAEKLKDDYELTTSAHGPTETRSGHETSPLKRDRAPIIVLGEPHGYPTGNSASSSKELRQALTSQGVNFDYWADGWATGGFKPSHLLARDPVFVRTLSDEESDTKRAVDSLEAALRIVFDTREQIIRSLLVACRRVLWRSGGPAWSPLGDVSDPGQSSDDLDNIEARVASSQAFAEWLGRFVNPDAVIFHERLDENRPPALVRLLRDLVKKSLAVNGHEPVIRLRPLNELPNFGADRLTIVAVDDLPIAPGADFREGALQRFNEFNRRIQHIIDQTRTAASSPTVLRVAMLIEGAKLLGPADLAALSAWIPIRIADPTRDGASSLSVEPNDLIQLSSAAAGLANASRK